MRYPVKWQYSLSWVYLKLLPPQLHYATLPWSKEKRFGGLSVFPWAILHEAGIRRQHWWEPWLIYNITWWRWTTRWFLGASHLCGRVRKTSSLSAWWESPHYTWGSLVKENTNIQWLHVRRWWASKWRDNAYFLSSWMGKESTWCFK